ncbi:MAG: amidohydrolase [Chloroflexota bacterium]
MNKDRALIENGAVAISGDKLAAVLPEDELPAGIEAKTVIQAEGKVVMPGLINAHSHLAMTLFRGLVEDLDLIPWLEKVWKYELTVLDADSVRAGTKLAFAEMLRGGVTCAHDMYWYYQEVSQLAEEVGFRLIGGPPITGIGGIDFDLMISQAHDELKRLKDFEYVFPIVQAHSTYTTTPEMMHAVREFKQEYKVPFTTHASENSSEIKQVTEQYGKTPIELLAGYDLLDERTVLAHCVKMRDDEIAMLKDTGTHVVHCPESNLKLGSGVARIADMIAAGVNVCLGTDGTASNNDLNLFGEMRTAALLQKGVNEDPKVVSTLEALEMVTINGARAYGLDDLIGSLEVGKKADVILLDFQKLHLTPCHDIYANIVYSLGCEDIDTVIIDGKIHLDQGELVTIEEEALIAEVREIGARFE